MRISQWLDRLGGDPEFSELIQEFDHSGEFASVAYEARAFLVALSYLANPRKILIVTGSYDRCLQWQAKLALCGVPESSISQLPSGISALFEDAAPEQVALSDRIGALRSLVSEEPCITITTSGAALERTMPRDVLESAFIEIMVGGTLDTETLVQQLVNLGYEYAEPVRIPGQFSRRGGIVDVFASGLDVPVRIELFGDEIESIRSFDPQSQRSVGQISSLALTPSRETVYVSNSSEIANLILETADRESASLPEEAAERLIELIEADVLSLRENRYFDRIDLYRPLIFPDSGCAIDLLDRDKGMLILDEPLELDVQAGRAETDLHEALEARSARGEIIRTPAHDFMLPPEKLSSHNYTVSLSAMNALPDHLKLPRRVEVGASSMEPYRGRGEALAATLKTWLAQGFQLTYSTDQPIRAKSVLGYGEIHPTEDAFVHGNLAGGFVIPHLRLAVVTDAELFGVARLRLPQRRFTEGAPIATVLDLKEGDYVVHINFGVGIFRGMIKRIVEGVEREYLYIEYQAPDKLFVPADQLDRIQKYLNPGDSHPKLNRLTGTEWQKTISKAREDAQGFAQDLVKLYAQRKAVSRRPFGPDSPWQAEMEATFPWVETPSQMRAIKETKDDLMLQWPMDRLVCGDVGFGKTEVAIRAAFKAAQNGRQVAVLCPTTILSEQHFRNFKERLVAFPTEVRLLNRYTTLKDRRAILDGLKAGTVDIVIGTHALLSKEMAFKELGLVVIDEEQKFGVKHKEILKSLRVSVDVLTLTATPIPRTLSMALMDLRQMSQITDPPPGRLPIRTFVRPHSDEVIREAILRELARGGQVFFVYNRVQSIGYVAEKIRKLVPMARIGIGHGQMTEAELEPIMICFINGEIDVLLSTTIIENGIDIPNANTLIVENADRLGLSQLYQLRGRVGRSDRQAYAYLLYQHNKDLTPGAIQRLEALQEFSALGSGYSLAFRDLQIRGAGELLGAKQHGAMAAVGYELYTQLINEAVLTLKSVADGTGVPSKKDPLESMTPLPAFDVPVEAFIPETYIRDQAQRLFYYQGMMTSRNIEDLGGVQSEIEDRYGRQPAQLSNAFRLMELRLRGKGIGFEKLDGKGGRFAVTFKDPASIPPRAFSLLGRKNKTCYLTREQLIWPYSGDVLSSLDKLVHTFETVLHEIAEERELAASMM